MSTKSVGDWGEESSRDYLLRKGYSFVASGYRIRQGEIDIIVEDRDFLVFVEVKTRRNSDFALAREFVTREKQRKLILTAQMYLSQHPTEKQPRFDVVEVYAPYGTATRRPVINHIENAFGEPDQY